LKYFAHEQNYAFRTPVLTSEIEIFPRSSLSRIDDGMKVFAVWDTGATKTFINRHLSEQLCLVPIEFQPSSSLATSIFQTPTVKPGSVLWSRLSRSHSAWSLRLIG
jgi:hypothetical protein